MHLPAYKDGGKAGGVQGSLEKETVRKLAAVDRTGPSSPSSPGKKTRDQKPQKVLSCPRCESMNTKFCYYNNYSVNQPRHFCRQCQRYWTVGGTLRNVPVGGGSRKKNRHQREEPYLRSSPVSGSPLAMATAGGQPGMQNMGFQQLLTHDMAGFNFSQLPGFVPQNPYVNSYPVDQRQGMYNPMSSRSAQQEFSSLHPLYGAHAGAMTSQQMQGATVPTYYPDLGSLQGENPSGVGVKTEFWVPNMMPQNQPQGGSIEPQVQGLWEQSTRQSPATGAPCNVSDEVEKTGNSGSLQKGSKSAGYDSSSMLLHLGLNTGPQIMTSTGKPGSWSQNSRGGPAPPTTGSSPPHGSSTIEEEGSTPTNGYSNSGYEEGDAVSSMWHDMHDMHDIFQ